MPTTVLPVAALGLGFELDSNLAATVQGLMSRADREITGAVVDEIRAVHERAHRLMPRRTGRSAAGAFFAVHVTSDGDVVGRAGVRGVPYFKFVRFTNFEAVLDRIRAARQTGHTPKPRDLRQLKAFGAEQRREGLSGKSAFVELFQRPTKASAANLARVVAERMEHVVHDASRAA